MDSGLEPERNGILEHSFLSPASRDKERRNIRTKLLCNSQLLLKSPDETEEEHFVLVATHKIIQGGNRKFLKPRVRHGRMLVLATKSGRNDKVQDIQLCECHTRKNRPCNSLTLLADMRASKKHICQVSYFYDDNLGHI